ncbi:FAD-dependent oxidoreductase [Lentzea sp. NPDC060358]|uniref:FAD-dependent oxidoreductase n=1 Tax=Lentzea sp. NPDC060358 TaxID=3347103 RepID=UPI00365B5EFD
MRVIVVGAGIGGLVLARGLRAAGAEVVVHERDSSLADTGGYRLHLTPEAAGVLRRRLPPPVFQALLAGTAGARSFREFGVLDHRLRPVARLPLDDAGEHLMIGRIPLRRLLGHGLGAAIRFGSEFTGLVHDSGGTVTAEFADGTRETADLLVGADGARSRVVTALTGRPAARRLAAHGLAGRAPLDDAVRSGLPDALLRGPAFAIAPSGVVVFLTLHDPSTAPVAPEACREVPPIVEPGYVLWGVVVPAGTPASNSSALASARHLLDGFAPWVHTLLDLSDPAQTTRFPYYAADPDADLTPWQAGAVTALGDAVHAMPPTGGRGASTAILDADVLTDHLSRPGTPIPLALHDFHRAMALHAPPAVRESLQPLLWQQRVSGRVGRVVLRSALALAGTAYPLLAPPKT